MPDFEPIAGRYITIDIAGERHRIFIEEAGRGLPLLCLHTAGNDSRQFRHMMNDGAITDGFASSPLICRITAARRRRTAGGSRNSA
jgi:hypothetical protein